MTAPCNRSRWQPGPGDALVVVDVQNDFLPEGALAVPEGDAVVPVLNACMELFLGAGLPVFATRDWHPAGHCSFEQNGGPWPPHCVQDTAGAGFAADLKLPASAKIISKGTDKNAEAYSGFQDTPLAGQLQSLNVKRIFVGGLATDYCVLNTVQDALAQGLDVVLLEDAVRAVDVKPGDGLRAIEAMVASGCTLSRLADFSAPAIDVSPLLTDLYQLTMLQSYREQKMDAAAVFEFYVRALPPGRGFLLAAGLEHCLEFLEHLRFTREDLGTLEKTGHFSTGFLESLTSFRFTGDVDAMPEGTVVFADEPLLRVTAPLMQAQFVESRIINLLQYSTLVASKAARMVLAAGGKTLVDFGFRRAHGAEAGLLAARASYLAGFAGTATVKAGALWGIPLFGTMAHSYILAHEDELAAFENFAASQPDNLVLLLDTHDTVQAALKAAKLAARLNEKGTALRAVRLDSGDLAALARQVREIFDERGLTHVRILASGDLDETKLTDFAQSNAPIDGYGIGTRLTTSADAPNLNCVYKLQEYAGVPRRKHAQEKSNVPGAKQVFRRFDETGCMQKDVVARMEETQEGMPLLQPVMRAGKRTRPLPSLEKIRERTRTSLAALPEALRSLGTGAVYPVEMSRALKELIAALDAQRHT